MTSIRILFAHPDVGASRVNSALCAMARGVADVSFSDLYWDYPDFTVDVAREQDACLAADVIVFQHPFYWYSAPALLKEWVDRVFEHGWAYGANGRKLRGKALLSVITTGGSDQSYRRDGANRYTMEELLAPYEQMANLCGMSYLPPLVFHDAHNAQSTTIGSWVQTYKDRLTALANGDGMPPQTVPGAPIDTEV